MKELQEQIQEDLLTYFESTTLGTQLQHQKQMNDMCDIIIKKFKRYERTTKGIN